MLPERMKGAGYWSLSLASTDLTLDSEHDKGKREISMSTRMNKNDIYNISMEKAKVHHLHVASDIRMKMTVIIIL